MNILIIEDNEYKYNYIKESLSRILDDATIVWKKTRNAGLQELIKNYRNEGNKLYDLIICDNFLPLCDEEMCVKPFAADIVNEVRKTLNLKDLTIIIWSSDDIEECDYNYIIEYDPRILIDEQLRNIINDILVNKQIPGFTNI